MACNKSLVILMVLTGIAFSVSSCLKPGKGDETGISDKKKFRQYMVMGKKLYSDNCANCHQEDGSGLRQLYPPLRNSDYFKNKTEKILCVIKNGHQGGITVNGILFEQEMPDNPSLTNLDIAAISTYVLSTYGEKAKLISQEDIKDISGKCNDNIPETSEGS